MADGPWPMVPHVSLLPRPRILAKTEDEEERKKGWKVKRFDSRSHRLDHASCVASITPLVDRSSLQTLRRKDRSELQKPSRQDRPDEILRLADYHTAGLSSRLVSSRRLASQGVEPSRPIDGSAAPGVYRLQPAALLLEGPPYKFLPWGLENLGSALDVALMHVVLDVIGHASWISFNQLLTSIPQEVNSDQELLVMFDLHNKKVVEMFIVYSDPSEPFKPITEWEFEEEEQPDNNIEPNGDNYLSNPNPLNEHVGVDEENMYLESVPVNQASPAMSTRSKRRLSL
uniref:Uncharacterized protein n=1 Tax=Oryza glumipatula TaxID=40148 RepID=A0A0E0AB40_9ORYZ